ncbi:hypothetical protein, partial [Escherichia coli]
RITSESSKRRRSNPQYILNPCSLIPCVASPQGKYLSLKQLWIITKMPSLAAANAAPLRI